LHIEGEDAAHAVGVVSRSRDRVDRWFTRELAAAAGLDLDRLPWVGFPELVSSYGVEGTGRDCGRFR
jgi:anti-sigma factor RsiW